MFAPERSTSPLAELEQSIVPCSGDFASAAASHPSRDQRAIIVLVRALMDEGVCGPRRFQHVARLLTAIGQSRKAPGHGPVGEGKEPRVTVDQGTAVKPGEEGETNF